MPKGHHYGRTQIRAYTNEYHRIHANAFKPLLKAPLGSYLLDAKHLSKPHQKLKLEENKCGVRFITFTINEKPQKVTLALDDRSASNKLYITCPHCNKKRQHLYAVKNAYACRECLGLHYASQSERPQERLMRRIRKLRKELWGYDWPDVNNMFEQVAYWPKPKWMRWKTFKEKQENILILEAKYWSTTKSYIQNTFEHHY